MCNNNNKKNVNFKLKTDLVVQSFAPLFILLFIKYCHCITYFHLILKFADKSKENLLTALNLATKHELFGSFVIFLVALCWICYVVLVTISLKRVQKSGFSSYGEKIKIEESHANNSAAFLMTYILPLLGGDFDNINELLTFLVMLFMIIVLLSNTDDFYHNPVLTFFKYKTFYFTFNNPNNDISAPNKVYIGITRNWDFQNENTIVRKRISKGVFLINKS